MHRFSEYRIRRTQINNSNRRAGASVGTVAIPINSRGNNGPKQLMQSPPARLFPLHDAADSQPAAAADGEEAVPDITPHHLVDQCREPCRTGGTDGMSQ